MMHKECAVILLILLKSTLSIPVDEFYPFGAESTGQSTTLANGDNSVTMRIFTRGLWRFFDTAKDSVIVSYT